jgi:hypothetical protein
VKRRPREQAEIDADDVAVVGADDAHHQGFGVDPAPVRKARPRRRERRGRLDVGVRVDDAEQAGTVEIGADDLGDPPAVLREPLGSAVERAHRDRQRLHRAAIDRHRELCRGGQRRRPGESGDRAGERAPVQARRGAHLQAGRGRTTTGNRRHVSNSSSGMSVRGAHSCTLFKMALTTAR